MSYQSLNASGLPYNIRLSTDIANPLFINDANATPVTTQDTLGKIDFPLIQLHRISTPTTIIALFYRLAPTPGADHKG
jgi:hypothetical protein